MRLRTLAVGVLLLVGGVDAVSAQAADPALMARGAYVAKAADCAACHTDPAAGKAYAGGYAIQSPLGTIYSTNITPSHDHGIGDWSEKEFARAVREGVAKDGTHLYPAMPYDAYSGMTDDDIHALYAYFQGSVAPVDEAPAKRTSLGFPYGIRASMIGWNLLYLDHHRYESVNGQVPDASRGRYLVDVLGHCGSCHTPRNTLMAADSSSYLAGADLGGWHAPDITSDPVSGIGGWSEDELASFLKNGHVDGKAIAAGGMAEAVEHSLRHLTDADLHVMAAYLKSVPAKGSSAEAKASYAYGEPASSAYGFSSPAAQATANAADAARTAITGTPSNAGKPADITNGAQLFESACATCHQPAGSGTADHYYPSLYRNSTTGAATPNNLVMTILEGVKRVGADGPTAMPAFKDDLDDEQVAAVASFVSKRFGNAGMAIDAAKVAELRRGGPPAKIQSLMPWLLGVGVVVLLGVVILIVSLVRRRRRRHRRQFH